MTCAICKEHTDIILQFSENTLTKCKNILQVRINNNFKYSDVTFPTSINGEIGYHVKCYQKFTAVMKKYLKQDNPQTSQPSTSEVIQIKEEIDEEQENGMLHEEYEVKENYEEMEQDEIHKENEHGMMPEKYGVNDNYEEKRIFVCFFCQKKNKTHRQRHQKLYASSKYTYEDLIEKYNQAYPESDMWQRFLNLKTEQIYYHHICKMTILNKNISFEKDTQITEWHDYRHYHKMAFEEISEIIEENILVAQKSYFLSHLNALYVTSLRTIAEDHLDEHKAENAPHQLRKKIERRFPNDIKIVHMHGRNIVMPKNAVVLDRELLFQQLEESELLQKAALCLRKTILKMKEDLSSKDISAEDSITNECNIPENLKDFCYSLFGGTDQKRHRSANCKEQVKSVAEHITSKLTLDTIETSDNTTRNEYCDNI